MPTKSFFPDVDIPDLDIPTFFLENADRGTLRYSPDKPIFFDGSSDKTLSYNQVKKVSRSFGAGLVFKWGWKKGDVMCIVSPNHIDYASAMWGVHYALGGVTTANPAYGVDELAFQLQNSKSKGVIAHPQTVEIVVKACDKIGLPRNRILLIGRIAAKGVKSWETMFSGKMAPSTNGRINPKEDVAFIVYSSGTTGLPKG